MLIRFGYRLEMTCPQSIQMVCLLDSHPDEDERLVSKGSLAIEPLIRATVFDDPFGNEVLRFTTPKGRMTISRDSILQCDGQPQSIALNAREVAVADLPSEVLAYLYGSRYCDTDVLDDTAWRLFGDTAPGWARVQAVCDFVNQHLTFGYQHARQTRMASHAYEERVGVCRDFAHLAVTFCRCLNIPARYVNGFLGDIGVPVDPSPMDYNAWFEAYLDGRWYVFDARHNIPRIGRITVARGRDAADTAMVTSFGPHILDVFEVWTEVIQDP